MRDDDEEDRHREDRGGTRRRRSLSPELTRDATLRSVPILASGKYDLRTGTNQRRASAVVSAVSFRFARRQ
jgi:hypothetical protein